MNNCLGYWYSVPSVTKIIINSCAVEVHRESDLNSAHLDQNCIALLTEVMWTVATNSFFFSLHAYQLKAIFKNMSKIRCRSNSRAYFLKHLKVLRKHKTTDDSHKRDDHCVLCWRLLYVSSLSYLAAERVLTQFNQ